MITIKATAKCDGMLDVCDATCEITISLRQERADIVKSVEFYDQTSRGDDIRYVQMDIVSYPDDWHFGPFSISGRHFNRDESSPTCPDCFAKFSKRRSK